MVQSLRARQDAAKLGMLDESLLQDLDRAIGKVFQPPLKATG